MASSSSPSGGVWLEQGLALALVLACGLALSPNLADADLWGHVRYGLDTMSTGVAATTTYSYSAEGYRWINHENLSEILLGAIASTAGGSGLMIFKCLLGLTVVGLILWTARSQQASTLTRCIVALLVSVNLTHHWSVRPQIISYVLFAALMALATWTFRGWQGDWHLPLFRRFARAGGSLPGYESRRMRFLWCAPLILLVWANSHGGFVAGLCIYLLLLICRGTEVIARGVPNRWGILCQFVLMIAVAVLSTLINPYGPDLHRWLFHSLGQPRPEIAEWHSPEWFSLHTLPLWILTTVSLLALVLSRRPIDFTHIVVLGVTLWQSFTHQRHVPFFAILFGFWITPHIDSMLARFRASGRERRIGVEVSPKMRFALAAGLIVALSLLITRLHGRLSELVVHKDTYPVSAMQYIADTGLSGKLLVTYNWAQYALAVFGTDHESENRLRVGFDGRFRTCYPQEVVDMHFDFILGNGGPKHRWRGPGSPPFDPTRALDFEHPNLVLISRQQPHAVRVMRTQADRWSLLYQDQLAQLWGRAELYNDRNLASYLPASRRFVSDDPQTGIVNWPAIPEFRRKSHGELARSENADKGARNVFFETLQKRNYLD